jgi:hypothetical protein
MAWNIIQGAHVRDSSSVEGFEMGHTDTIWLWVSLVGVGLAVISVVPVLQVRRLTRRWQMHPKEQFAATNEARKTIAQVVGGLAILIGLYFTNRTIAMNYSQLRLAEDGQLNDRYNTLLRNWVTCNESSG